MQVVCERCAGLDVHKKTVVASVITPEGQETRTFGTMTKDLLEMADWFVEKGVTHVAMESTGVYWKPVYNVLEEGFTVLVVNAHHIKAVPGRKTEVKDESGSLTCCDTVWYGVALSLTGPSGNCE